MNQVLDKLIEAGEKKLINCSVFFDLAKAFNTVNHNILISKLKRYNIKGSLLNLLKDYLKDRRQSTVINNVVSEHEFVNVRIPKVLVWVLCCLLCTLMIFLRLLR